MARGKGDITLFAARDHAHLKLTTALAPEPRGSLGGGGGGLRHPDRAGHGRLLRSQVSEVQERHTRRSTVFGVDPDLVLVIETNRLPDPKSFEGAGLQVLGTTETQAMVAFSSDPDMKEFRERCDLYSKGVRPGKKSARHEGFFDAIERVRSLEPDDVLDPDLANRLDNLDPSDLLRLDIQCWCPEDEPETRRRHRETRDAIKSADGIELAASCRWQAGLSLIRADVPAGKVKDLAAVDRVRWISRLPRPLLTVPEVINADIERLPTGLSPAESAPLVAVIDSGVRTGHPLLAPAVVVATSLGDNLLSEDDEEGHGTMVASLALYGSLEPHLDRRSRALRPAGRLLSIRVLDAEGNFPDTSIWEEHLERAVELAAQEGARVVNISLGDRRHPYHAPAPTPIAAILDHLARVHDLVIVVCTGNFAPSEYPRDPDIITSYPSWLLEHEGAGLIPPAMSALALTVGGLVPDSSLGVREAVESVDKVVIGRPGESSPVSRVGPGIEKMIKPELVATAGSYVYDHIHGSVMGTGKAAMVVGAGATTPDRLLAMQSGTSFAAPLVSHAALRVLGHYPSLSANGVRALLLASAQPVEDLVKDREDQRRLSGYGRVSAELAEFSSDYRAVLLAEEEVEPDQVHFYAIPVPDSFFEYGQKKVSVSLAFDPDVRATRLTYLSSRMSVFAYRGVALADVRASYVKLGDDEEAPRKLNKYRIDLQPANQSRHRGPNQAASATFARGWSAHYRDHPLVIVVRNMNRWAQEGQVQRYALAVVLETGEALDPPLYSQLRAEYEVLAEVEPEIELG